MDFMNLNVFESDDEEFMESDPRIRCPKVIRNRPNHFEEFDDLQFFTRFRLQKSTVRLLLNLIEGNIKSRTNMNHAISPESKLCLALRFYATGNMLIAVGDFAGVSKTSACNIVTQVTEEIAKLRPQYVKFPNSVAERLQLQEEFYRKARFPQVIGAIDCSHIRIQSPGGDEAERYRNRKGYFSWNVQVIGNPRLEIMDIVARWPGSSHDQTIFNNSRIKGKLRDSEFRDSILLGDNGYANTNIVITPLEHPSTETERLFNESHIRTRNCIERLFGVWKRRFPILALGLRVSLPHSQAIIVATAVLHNLAIREKDGNPPIEIEINENNVGEENINFNHEYLPDQDNNRTRNRLLNEHFSNLV